MKAHGFKGNCRGGVLPPRIRLEYLSHAGVIVLESSAPERFFRRYRCFPVKILENIIILIPRSEKNSKNSLGKFTLVLSQRIVFAR